MEASSPWDDLAEESQQKTDDGAPLSPQPISISEGFAPMNQGTLLTGTAQMPTGQLIYLQPPSSAAKVLGIIMLIYGVVIGLLTLISLLTINIINIDELAALYAVDKGDQGRLFLFLNISLAFTLFTSIAFVLAGVWVKNFQRKGIMLALLLTLIGFVFDTAIVFIFPEFMSGGLIAPGRGGIIVEGVFTSMFCGLIWASPLMVANNGLDESKLFG
jgi:hypothetical protein